MKNGAFKRLVCAAVLLLAVCSCAHRPAVVLSGFGENEVVLPTQESCISHPADGIENGLSAAVGKLGTVESVFCAALPDGLYLTASVKNESDSAVICAALRTFLSQNGIDAYCVVLSEGALIKERGRNPEFITRAPEATVEQPSVWITAGGSKYHFKHDCGGMEGAYSVTLTEALDMGREPCSRCCK